MSKAVRWQVPFAAHDGTRYRVDIYDEGYTGNPVVLTAGETPFTTDEDDSDDFFAPVRTQTGTLQVCTDIEGSSTPLKMEDILPENNIAHPVRLLKYANGSYSVIEWQGFLSCEAYSQDYIGIPQNLDLPLIGVLEAMASVEVNPTTLSGMMYVFEIVYNTFHEIEQQSGMSLFDYIFYPKTDWRIFTKYIDATAFFKQNEYNNENSTTYIVSGLSCKEVLEKIATYMGWIVREHKTWLYFQRVGEDLGMYRQSALDFVAAFHSPGYYISRPLVTKELATDPAVVWMGTGHQRTVAAGAKSVEVVAKLEKFSLKQSLPECPVGNLKTIYSQLWEPQFIGYGPTGQPIYSTGSDWMYLLGNKNVNAYSNMSFAHFSALYYYDIGDLNPVYRDYLASSINSLLNNVSIVHNSPAKRIILTSPVSVQSSIRYYAGAFLGRYCWEEDDQAQTHDTKNALYCTVFPLSIYYLSKVVFNHFDETQVSAIFSMRSMLRYSCSGGWLRLQADVDLIYEESSTEYIGNLLTHSEKYDGDNYLVMELKFGNMWWDGYNSQWTYEETKFNAKIEKGNFAKTWTEDMPIEETDGTLIPLPNYIEGELVLKIWPMASETNHHNTVYEMIFKRLDIDYIKVEDDTLTDRSENKYFSLLGTNFRDEISINTDLASWLSNQQSPSLIMDGINTPMTVLDYETNAQGTTESRRPEVDLLNRLATYYGAARQRLELEVAHITTPLPMLRLNGIDDGKVYLPLAESRDWRTGVCKLTCFECPS